MLSQKNAMLKILHRFSLRIPGKGAPKNTPRVGGPIAPLRAFQGYENLAGLSRADFDGVFLVGPLLESHDLDTETLKIMVV